MNPCSQLNKLREHILNVFRFYFHHDPWWALLIPLHVLNQARVSGEQIITYRPQHQTSFCFVTSSQILLATGSSNRLDSRRSWSSHLSIPIVPADGRFSFTTDIYYPLVSHRSMLLCRSVSFEMLFKNNSLDLNVTL